MTGGLWEEGWEPVRGRVASTLHQPVVPPPIVNAPAPPDLPYAPEQELEANDPASGDGGDPWVLVLLGKEGCGKSSTGNSILGTQAFGDRNEGEETTNEGIVVYDGVLSAIEVPVKVLDTCGYGGDQERNKENIDRLVNLLQEQIRMVHAFVVVVNCKDSEQLQTFNMIRDYVEAFGNGLLSNLVVVVTHWSMSESANETRESDGISREKFTEAWIDSLGQRVSLCSMREMIPFVFLDNQIGMLGESAHLAFDETELECFEASRYTIFQHLSASPVFSCTDVYAHRGYHKCSKCGRYFIPVDENALSNATSGVACASQASVAAARIARVARATSRAWTPRAAMKAMTRGWYGRAGGLHLFGKLVSRAGLAVQIGFGVYRFVSATNSTEKAKAAIGTSAGIVGGWGGAAWGASFGTMMMPGIGTVLGGIVGGIAGAVGLQVGAEKCVDGILSEPELCLACQE